MGKPAASPMFQPDDDEEEYVTPQPNSQTAGGGVNLTEVKVAEKFAKEVLDGSYLYTRQFGWLKWTGKRWREIETERMVKLAGKTFARWYSVDLAALMADRVGGDVTALLRRYFSKAGIEAVLSLSRGHVMEDGSVFDQDPDLINTASGVVDLRTGELLSHDPKRRMTKLINVPYSPDAENEDWDKTTQVLRPDAREYVQTRLGQSLTGYVPEDDVILFLKGSGANGKTTLITAVMKAMGPYARILSDKFLSADAYNGVSTEMMDLFGTRAAFVEELPERRLNITLLKKTTAAEIVARRLYKDTVQFTPSHSMMITSNYDPAVYETDWGTWRRLQRIAFPYTYRETEAEMSLPTDRLADRGLRDRVRRDPEVRAAALAWLVQGAVKWYASGRRMPGVPASVEKDTKAWRRETDVVLRYFDEFLEVDPDGYVPSSVMYEHFSMWMSDIGRRPYSDQLFADRFGESDIIVKHGITKHKKKVSKKTPPSVPRCIKDIEPGRSVWAWLGVKYRNDTDE